MATQKTQNPKIRTGIVLGIIAVMILAAVFGIYYWRKESALQSGANVASAPSIPSVPGAGNPSEQYVQDQTTQNAQEVAQARKEGTSSVPTLTRSNFEGN